MVQLPALEQQQWVKQTLSNVSQYMDFCHPFVDYDTALPAQNLNNVTNLQIVTYGSTLAAAVAAQDQQAQKLYFYHLAGMGIEPWDHQSPAAPSGQPLQHCARSVAKMVCFTLFPQAYASLLAGQTAMYMRPCKNSCENYLQACDVECCDESVKCTWDAVGVNGNNDNLDTPRTTQGIDGQLVTLQTGYGTVNGPSFTCTGAADPRAEAYLAFGLTLLLAGLRR